MPVKAVVTYDGLPVSSGGGHTLRSRCAQDAFDQVMRFLDSCTAPSQPVRFTIELITGNGIPEHFSAPLLTNLTKQYGPTHSRSLGSNTGHVWAIPKKDVGSTLALIDDLRPLPVHPYKLQPISLNILSFFQLINPADNNPYPHQDPESCLHFQPGFGQQLGVSQAYARISERSTLSLFLNFPLLDEGGELVRAVQAAQAHLPFQLSKSHWKRWSLTKRGDSYLGRKIGAPAQSPNISFKADGFAAA